MNPLAPLSIPLSILIVDDEPPARERLRTLLGDLGSEVPHTLVDDAVDGVAALARLQEPGNAIDLVFVDVRMPRMDGLELAQHLARLPAPPAVVFTTAYDHYAVQAFELSAVDYLLKPIRSERLRQALGKVTERRGGAVARNSQVVPETNPPAWATLNPDARRYLSCHERGKLLLVPVAEVLYFRADAKYVTARTAEREYLLNDALLALENEFGERFIRLHRSVVVARDALAGFVKGQGDEGDQWTALLKGVNERLPISRRHWPTVKGFARQLAGE